MNADKSNIERIILNFLEGSASERELEILRKWIDEDSSRQAELTRLCDLWQAATISRAPIRYDAKKAWQEMLRDKSIKPPKPSDNKVYFTLLKVAAIIILVLLSGYLTSETFPRERENIAL